MTIITANDRDLWRARWLGCINELTSFNLQKKSWLDKNHTNPHWSFLEFMSSYFDDLALDDHYKLPLEKSWITKEEFEIIKGWHKVLANYVSPKNNDYNNKTVLNDPKWLSIVQSGVTARDKLAEILSKRERQLLTEEIDYLKYQ